VVGVDLPVVANIGESYRPGNVLNWVTIDSDGDGTVG
jgi:hypothetical protein